MHRQRTLCETIYLLGHRDNRLAVALPRLLRAWTRAKALLTVLLPTSKQQPGIDGMRIFQSQVSLA